MNRIIKYFINNSFLVNIISIFIILIGVISISMMDRDLIPPFKYQSIMVSMSLPGASPDEVEKYLAFPVEDSLNGLPGIKKMRSRSRQGSLSLGLTFDYSVDIEETLALVKERIQNTQASLPESTKSIVVKRDKVTDVFMANIKLDGFDPNNTQHVDQKNMLLQDIRSIKGIVRVREFFNDLNLFIRLNQKKLQQYEIPVSHVRTKLLSFLKYTPVGSMKEDGENYSISISPIEMDVESLLEVPLRANLSGRVLRIKDVATVDYRTKDKQWKLFFGGKRSHKIRVRKDTFSDSINVNAQLQQKLQDFNKSSPMFTAETYVDGAYFIQKQLSLLSTNGLFGMALVLLVLMLFLNFRTSLMTCLGIPIAYCGTLAVLYMMDIDLNLLSVVGLLMVIGILVDDAIIVSERYSRNLQLGLNPKEAAYESVKSLVLPVTGTVLTTVVAFSPILFIKSDLSILLFSIPIVVIVSLGLSLFESFFILPNHLMHFVKNARAPGDKFIKWLRVYYERTLWFFVKWRYALLVVAIVGLGGSYYLGARKIRQQMHIGLSIPYVTIHSILKQSDSLQHTYEKVLPLEKAILKLAKNDPDFTHVSTYVGGAYYKGSWKEGYRYADLGIYLNQDDNYPSRLEMRVNDKVKKIVDKYKSDEFELLGLDFKAEGKEDVKKNMLTVSVSGKDESSFGLVRNSMDQVLKDKKIIKGYVDGEKRTQSIWQFEPNSLALLRYGMTASDLAQQIRGLIMPDLLIETRLNGEKVKIYTEFKKPEFLTKKYLSRFRVHTSLGSVIPLSMIGQWELKSKKAVIHHKNGLRTDYFDYEFDPKVGNIAEAKSKMLLALSSLNPKFPRLSFDVNPADEKSQENMLWALKVAAVCIVAVLFIIALVLRSLTLPFLVGLPIPFAIAGIFLSLYVHDMPLTILGIVGLMGTVGVAVNDSIIMVDQIQRLTLNGASSVEQIISGASSRLRAIFLTTVTTLGGLIPIAYSVGGESVFTRPLAFAMSWGLLVSTAMTLVFLPTAMVIRNDILLLVKKLFSKRRSFDNYVPVQPKVRDVEIDTNIPSPAFKKNEGSKKGEGYDQIH